MARELILMRHAKSDWPEGVADFNRPLKKRGRKAAQAVGEWLLALNLLPDWIVASPAQRARETAEKLCKGLGLKKRDSIHYDDRIYESSPNILKNVLADCPTFAGRVLLIGHNPGLDALLVDLVAGVVPAEDGKLFATATVARLSLPDNWLQLNPQSGQLLELRRASSLYGLDEDAM
ncbi:SixA phosphatase family protein [Methylomonas sp. MgM2]